MIYLGTQLQEVYDAFFVKVPETKFTNQESLVFQLFKASLAYCYRTVPESLKYTLTDKFLFDGYFDDVLGQDTIELIAMCMKRELYRRKSDRFSEIKQHIGTQAFSKLPNAIEQSKEARLTLEFLNDEIDKFRQEFYHLDN